MKLPAALAALAALALVPGFAAAQDDAFLMDSEDMAPDFDTPPHVEPGDAAVLAEQSPEGLEASADELLGEEPAEAPAPEPPESAPEPTRPAAAKETPSLGVVLAMGALAAIALARRR